MRVVEARDPVHVQCASQLGVLRACIDELSGRVKMLFERMREGSSSPD